MSLQNERLLRYVVDIDGTLDPYYARRVFTSTISVEHFRQYAPGENAFKETAASRIFEYAAWYYNEYQRPPTDTALTSDLFTRTQLLQSQKQEITDTLRQIRRHLIKDNEFEYAMAEVTESYVTNKAVSIVQRGLVTIKTDARAGVNQVRAGLTQLMYEADDEHMTIDSQALNIGQFASVLKSNVIQHGSLITGLISYPYASFNNLLGGMAPGELIVIAGDSNAGKSFIGRDIAYHVGLNLGELTVCADREMSHLQQGMRFAARMTGLPSRKLRKKENRSHAEEALLIAALESMEQWDDPETTPMLFLPPNLCRNALEIRQQIDTTFGNRAPKCIVADYLNEFDPSRKVEGHEAIGCITRDLKRLGQHYECPVVTMAQMGATGKKVQYKVIREVCDTLLLISMSVSKPYVPPGEGEFIGTPGIVEVWIDKARNEVKNVGMQLEVEYATSSIRQAGRQNRSAISSASQNAAPLPANLTQQIIGSDDDEPWSWLDQYHASDD